MHNSYRTLIIQDVIQYKESKIINYLLSGAKRLPSVLKKLIVPVKNIHSHNTGHFFYFFGILPYDAISAIFIEHCN